MDNSDGQQGVIPADIMAIIRGLARNPYVVVEPKEYEHAANVLLTTMRSAGFSIISDSELRELTKNA